jgi:hypothetical protein
MQAFLGVLIESSRIPLVSPCEMPVVAAGPKFLLRPSGDRYPAQKTRSATAWVSSQAALNFLAKDREGKDSVRFGDEMA